MLRIQRRLHGQVTYTLSGRMDAEDVAELERLLGLENKREDIALDLRDVTLVDRVALRFLAACETNNIKLENCPAYVRDWMGTEKRR